MFRNTGFEQPVDGIGFPDHCQVFFADIRGAVPERIVDHIIIDGRTELPHELFPDGTNGVIGLDGTELIPFSENDVIMVNDMGTVAVTREEYTSYTIHTFGKTE